MKKEVARNGSNNERVEFHKHPPERRRWSEAKLYCNGGCCCCCCCLHSLGGLIGAAVASRRKQRVSGGAEIGQYWLFLLSLTGLTIISCAVLADNVVLGIVGFLILTPAIQLVCSVVMAIWVKVRAGENAADKSARLWTIGKITLWSVLGAVAGFLAMVLLFRG